MKKGVDDGDIYVQRPISLQGTLHDIFDRMITEGTEGTKQFLTDYGKGTVRFTPQTNLADHPPFARRKPEESIMTLERLRTTPFVFFNNCVRAVADPYPNVTIPVGKTSLSVTEVKKLTRLSPGIVPLTTSLDEKALKQASRLCVKLRDGYAELTRYHILPGKSHPVA
jgi:methionyl-tRNA formyltransferase